MKSELLTIDEASDRTGLSPEDIEYAEQTGLLAAGRESEGRYTAQQIRSMDSIARLNELGLSIDDISGLDLPPDVLADVSEYLSIPQAARRSREVSAAVLRAGIRGLRSHESVVTNQIAQLQNLKNSLDQKSRALGRILELLNEHANRAA